MQQIELLQKAFERGVRPDEDVSLVGVSFGRMQELLDRGALPADGIPVYGDMRSAEFSAKAQSMVDCIAEKLGVRDDGDGCLSKIAAEVVARGLQNFNPDAVGSWRLRVFQRIIDDFLPQGDPRRAEVTPERILDLVRQCLAQDRRGYVVALDQHALGERDSRYLAPPSIPANAVRGIEPLSSEEWDAFEAKAHRA